MALTLLHTVIENHWRLFSNISVIVICNSRTGWLLNIQQILVWSCWSWYFKTSSSKYKSKWNKPNSARTRATSGRQLSLNRIVMSSRNQVWKWWGRGRWDDMCPYQGIFWFARYYASGNWGYCREMLFELPSSWKYQRWCQDYARNPRERWYYCQREESQEAWGASCCLATATKNSVLFSLNLRRLTVIYDLTSSMQADIRERAVMMELWSFGSKHV